MNLVRYIGHRDFCILCIRASFRLNLSPVVILLFLVFWGWLWGITGALLAVPLAAAIQIALAHIPALAPLAVMMGSGKRYAKKNPPPENRTAEEQPADTSRA